ncbi:MAG: translation initiation factor IF-2 [bacterium]|nr:translation initiation factor IF-2 [bacterium]
MKTAKKPIKEKLAVRPPVVVVMGHVDHGKTKILDYIRKTKVAEGESGGITQHIGAYEIEHNGKKITFIDTPGHEAFSAMRSRGAKVADIAILVVAADDGVKPQTKEAISIIKNTGLPYVVALNKIDKPGIDVQRVRSELAENEVLVEGWGGNVPIVEISAKTGEHINDLLETLLLVAEIEEVGATPKNETAGLVIESHLDHQRGATATLLVREGAVDKKDVLVIGEKIEAIKIFENFKGDALSSATSSMPFVVAGLNNVPIIGQTFRAFKTKEEAAAYQETLLAEKEETMKTPAEEAPADGKPILPVILKTDVSGSREALEEIVKSLQFPEVGNKILKSEVGDVNESDVKLSSSAKRSIVFAFRVATPAVIKQLAENNGVTIISKDVIYEIIQAIKEVMSKLIPSEIKKNEVGRARVLALFKSSMNSRQVVGGKVESGRLRRGSKIDVIRAGEIVGTGKITGLQQQKHESDEVMSGFEFGLMTDCPVAIAAGDTLVAFDEEEIFKKL